MEVDQMNGPELRDRYNELANYLGLTPVERFRTVENGRTRVRALEAQWAEVQRGGAEEEEDDVQPDPVESAGAGEVEEEFQPAPFLQADNLAADTTPRNRSAGVPNPNARVQEEFGSPNAPVPGSEEATREVAGPRPRRTPRARPEVPEDQRTIHDEFQTRPGSIRAVLLDLMAERTGQPVTMAEIVNHLYRGDADKEVAAAMVLKGLSVMIQKRSLPYSLERKREDGVVTFTLKRSGE
jgi:hypothetical protein